MSASWLNSRSLMIVAVIVGFWVSAIPASAAAIIDNPINGVDGSCALTTACGAYDGAVNPFAAQLFNLQSATSLTNASLTAYMIDPSKPFSINWNILAVAANGLPGMVVANGASNLLTQSYLGEQFGLAIIKSDFDITGTTLGSGNYYFAIQAVSDAFDIYLATADGEGAAYTPNGSTWTSGYANGTAVAVSLSGEPVAAVPELTTWVMLIAGFGLTGLSLRRRRNGVTASPIRN